MCSISSGRPTHGCMRSSHTEMRGAGKLGSARDVEQRGRCSRAYWKIWRRKRANFEADALAEIDAITNP